MASWNYAITYDLIKGSYTSGQLSDTYSDDSTALCFTEVVDIPGYRVIYDFQDIPAYMLDENDDPVLDENDDPIIDISYINLQWHYSYVGDATNNIIVEVWNYDSTSWDQVTTNSDDFNNTDGLITGAIFNIGPGSNLSSIDSYLNNGNMRWRQTNSSLGNVSYTLCAAWLYLGEGSLSSSSSSLSSSSSSVSSSSSSVIPYYLPYIHTNNLGTNEFGALDNVYVDDFNALAIQRIASGSPAINTEFKFYNVDSSAALHLEINVDNNKADSITKVQIYNYDLTSWENLDDTVEDIYGTSPVIFYINLPVGLSSYVNSGDLTLRIYDSGTGDSSLFSIYYMILNSGSSSSSSSSSSESSSSSSSSESSSSSSSSESSSSSSSSESSSSSSSSSSLSSSSSSSSSSESSSSSSSSSSESSSSSSSSSSLSSSSSSSSESSSSSSSSESSSSSSSSSSESSSSSSSSISSSSSSYSGSSSSSSSSESSSSISSSSSS